MRKFEPLAADHPAIGEKCALCDRAFIAGDETTLVPKADGRAAPGELVFEASLCHWSCVQQGFEAVDAGVDLLDLA